MLKKISQILVCVLLITPFVAVLPQTAIAKSVETPAEAPPQPTFDVDLWNTLAQQAEAAVANDATPDSTLETLRGQLVQWRGTFSSIQQSSTTRLDTLRKQIASLGAPPENGAVEAPEISGLRDKLNADLAKLEAPQIQAYEAYSRADGIIAEINSIMRARQTRALMQRWPSPLNIANWPNALNVFSGISVALYSEAIARWKTPQIREDFFNAAPVIIFTTLIAIALLLRRRALIQVLLRLIPFRLSDKATYFYSFLLSLGQILIPLASIYLLSLSLRTSGLLGTTAEGLVAVLPKAGLALFGLYWLADRLFPLEDNTLPVNLSPEQRQKGRFLIKIYSWLLGANVLLRAVLANQTLNDDVDAIIRFPLIVLASVVLLQIGRLLYANLGLKLEAEEPPATDTPPLSMNPKILAALARIAMLVGVFGPLIAAMGYITAASAVVFPTGNSLILLGLLYVLQGVAKSIYAMVFKNESALEESLAPFFLAMLIFIASLPLFALIWGARLSDLNEFWTRINQGFRIGDIQISPTNLLLLVVVFIVGYAVTRLFQTSLRNSILPRTKIDRGAQHALISGTGYIGIFLAALVAITTAGIDLSGLAIVAGALSVGIGFGLQNIVSNFVSGIILLIERPISQGDWVTVGTVSGHVHSISVRSTRIETFDRNFVIVPNSDLVSGQVTNWTGFNRRGRLVVSVGVAYGTDTRKVERILLEIANEQQKMLIPNPKPSVILLGFGADSVDFQLRVFLRNIDDISAVHSEINHEIARRFVEEGIDIPFAQRDIYIKNLGDLVNATPGATPSS